MHKAVPANDAPGTDFQPLAVQNARVFKAGNSLAVRIPSALAKICELQHGAAVELGTGHGMIFIRKAPSHDLQALVDRITPENIHALELDELIGAERW